MKNSLLSCLLVILTAFAGHAQWGYNYYQTKNSFYIQAGTRSAPYSINYDRIFRMGEDLSYSYGFGFSYATTRFYVPLRLSAFVTGETPHHMELSVAIIPSVITTYKSPKPRDPISHFTGTLGYRYQRLENPGFFIKGGLGILFSVDPPVNNIRALLHPYGLATFSLGYSF